MIIKKYITNIITINKNQPLKINGANSFTLKNTGTTNAFINNFQLSPGETYVDSGWPNEENHSNYNISFTTGAGEVLLFIKQYI